jgi:ABC-type multidrug transport system ATPase subunit
MKRYAGLPRPANDQLNLVVREGEVFGILGENGAGKSTLVRQLVNLLRPTSGRIELFGRPLDAHGIDVALHVGYMPQHGDALNRLTVGEALYYTAHLRGSTPSEARAERDRLMERWGVAGLRDQDSATLSGGQRRMLRLAVAMAGRPPVLVLDEPTADLDPVRRRLVWEVLREANESQGTTIVFITHDTVEAEKVVHRVAILSHGRVVKVGRPADLKRELGNEVRLQLRLNREVTMPGEGSCTRLADGGLLLRTTWTNAMAFLNQLRPEDVDDIRMTMPTLEDVFIHHVDGP